MPVLAIHIDFRYVNPIWSSPQEKITGSAPMLPSTRERFLFGDNPLVHEGAFRISVDQMQPSSFFGR
jgi:hypothetical protein